MNSAILVAVNFIRNRQPSLRTRYIAYHCLKKVTIFLKKIENENIGLYQS